jgi:hypothetical protein
MSEARKRLDAEVGAVDYRPEAGPPAAPIAPDDAVAATAIVVRLRQTATVVRIHPVVEVDLVALAPDAVPRPLTLQLEVSVDQVPRLQPGAVISVTLSRLDHTRATVDWERTPAP